MSRRRSRNSCRHPDTCRMMGCIMEMAAKVTPPEVTPPAAPEPTPMALAPVVEASSTESDKGWTEERVTILRQCVAEGLSAGQAASKLGVTRAACTGKATRLGIRFRSAAGGIATRKVAGVASPGQTLKRADPSSVKVARGQVFPMPETRALPPLREVKTSVEPRPWLTRKFGECAWPVSGEGADVFSCCAPVAQIDPPYCAAHMRLRSMPSPYGFYAETPEQLQKSLRRYA